MLSKITKENNVILKLESEYLVASNSRELVEKALDLLSSVSNINEIILDLSKVKTIDSMGITFVVGLYKTALNTGKSYKVIGINSEINRLFNVMKLNNIFPIEVNQ